jgi:ABC-type histidine transport system ATPase subunit
MEPMVVARNVHKRYGEIEVLKGIDLEVDTGKVICIIGASGAGKVDIPALHQPSRAT